MEVAAGGCEEKFRCRRTGDRWLWRCNLQSMSGKVLCEKHWLEYERRKEKKKVEKLNKLRNKENGGGSNSVGDVGNGTAKNRVFDGIGISEGQGGMESGGEAVAVVNEKEKEKEKEKEMERPSGLEIRKELELMPVRNGDASGDCSVVRGKKRGRPKGSKNRKESSV